MASPCTLCNSGTKFMTPLLSEEDLYAKLDQKAQKKEIASLKRFLGRVGKRAITVDFGAGVRETLPFDAANRKYFERYFRNSGIEVYSCPPVFEYRYPGEPSDIIFSADPESRPPRLTGLRYDCLQEKRKGELPEDTTVSKFLALFRKNKTAAFIVHGYNWKARYLRNLPGFEKSNLAKSFYELFGEGEFDLLVSLPGKTRRCLIVIEVKAIDKPVGMENVIRKAFSQCEKTLHFLSKVNHDICESRNIPLIKVVALPNCESSTIGGHFCENCMAHVITKEQLSFDSLGEWFDTLISRYSCQLNESQLDFEAHEALVGRLIGPASLMEIRTIPESLKEASRQITEEHGTAESIDKRRFQMIKRDIGTGSTSTLRQIWHESDRGLDRVPDRDHRATAAIPGRWYQLNPDQIAVTNKDPQFLWLTGNPASGKTVLALWKIEQIFREAGTAAVPTRDDAVGETAPVLSSAEEKTTASSSFHPPPASNQVDQVAHDSVLYLFAGMSTTCLKEVFTDKVRELQTERCKTIIISMRDFHKNEKDNLPGSDNSFCFYFQELPRLIRYLQQKDEGKIIHIIFDESAWQLADLDMERFEMEWGELEATRGDNLGSVWVIQDTSYGEMESGSKAPEDFYRTHLSRIMRMSRQNVEVANLILNTTFQTGHAVSSYIPIVYRIKCMCTASKDTFHCHSCYDKRTVLLLSHVLDDFMVGSRSTSPGQLQAISNVRLKDIVLITAKLDEVKDLVGQMTPPVPFVKNKYSIPDQDCMSISTVDAYRGCEQSLVIIDFHNAACDDLKRLEGITRTLGQLVLLDGGTFPGLEGIYEEQMTKLKEAERDGIVQIKEVLRSPDEESKLYTIFVTHVINKGSTFMNLT